MKPKYNHRPYNVPKRVEENKIETEEAKVEEEVKTEAPLEEAKDETDEEVVTEKEVSTPAPVEAEEPKKEENDIPKIAAIAVDLCNVRKDPNPTAAILGTAIKNAEFRVDKNNTGNGYVAINFGGVCGYIREDLVRVFDNPAYIAHDVRKF